MPITINQLKPISPANLSAIDLRTEATSLPNAVAFVVTLDGEAEGGDDDRREAAHSAGDFDRGDDRGFLAAYCAEHQRLFRLVYNLP